MLAAHPSVAESAVVGVPHPETGETVRGDRGNCAGRPGKLCGRTRRQRRGTG
ncbi:AMP-binding enzyme [Micromonospora tarapacensis]|uniref:AMP-binding enzyme n=1 Tax=Micromonospora tarapacensis TaxID=2835305 RepID=UPI002F424B05